MPVKTSMRGQVRTSFPGSAESVPVPQTKRRASRRWTGAEGRGRGGGGRTVYHARLLLRLRFSRYARWRRIPPLRSTSSPFSAALVGESPTTFGRSFGMRLCVCVSEGGGGGKRGCPSWEGTGIVVDWGGGRGVQNKSTHCFLESARVGCCCCSALEMRLT